MRPFAFVAVLGLTLLVVVGSGRSQDRADLTGWYDVRGTNPTGTAYSGVAQLRQVDETWEIQWQIGQGVEGQAVGLGVLKGDTLSFIFQTSDGSIGLSVLTIDRKDGGVQLSGPWMTPGAPLGRETLTKVKAPPDVRLPV